MHVFLIEPEAGGRISGGYLYNARITREESTLARRAVSPDRLSAELKALELPEDAWLLADSLFLNREHLAAFRERCTAGQRLGIVLHSFPSFIRRAQQSRAEIARELPLRPSGEELRLVAAVDLVVAPGPYVPRLLAAAGCSVPTLICSPGIDRHANPLPPPRARAEPLQLLSIGSVTPLKGLLDAAEALGRQLESNFRWTIIGHLGVAPDHVAELRERTRALGFADRVALVGQRDHSETLAELRRSDLLLLTSYTENHPLVALEALAASVPIIGYAVGGLPDIVQHGESGLLSPLLDIDRLSADLGRVLKAPEERERLAEGCRRAAASLPSWADASRGFARAMLARGS